MKKEIESYNVTCDYDNSQFWPGHGIACTNYDDCATGIGSTPREALEDCLDSLAQNDIHFDGDKDAELLAALETQCGDVDQAMETEETDGEMNTDNSDSYFYVSIDVKFAEEKGN